MKKTTRLLSTLLAGTLLSFGFQQSAQAQTLNYTNTADAWLTPASWAPANNWNSGAVKTNATTANVRLSIGTNTTVNRAVSVTYDATMGATILNNAGTNILNMVIGSGNTTTGAVTVAGGTLIMQGGTPAANFAGVMVGNAAASNAVQASLTLAGGNFIFTNANGGGNGIMSVPYRGGSTNVGPNFASGTFTVGNGSTATVDRIFFGYNVADTALQTFGTININAGGTLSTRNIAGRDSDASQMTSTVNFNGGTLHVYGPNIAILSTPFISDAGSNLTLKALAGGAIIDTAGVNATSVRGLQNGGGGGGLTKNGLGTLTLNQTNTYTGPTVLNGGGLSLILPMSSSSLTMANGTTATISSRDHSWNNTVTSLTNATLNLALGAVTAIPNSSTAVLNTGTLNVSGVNTINITSGSGLPNGTVKLIDYTSSANRFGGGTFVLGTLAPGIQATLVDGPDFVSLNVSLSVQSLIWSGGTGDWQTNGAANWNSGSATYLEYFSGVGDVANFTDAAGSSYTVNLTSFVKPALANINITNASVTFSGTGRIVGANGLTKSGIGILNLANTNNYDGVTSIENGTLQVFNGFALGSSVGETVVASTGALTVGDGLTVSGETVRISSPGFGGSRGALRGIGNVDNTWAGPIVLGSPESRIGTEDSGKIIIAGPITDNGNTNALLYRPGNGGTIIVNSSAHSYFRTATFMEAVGTAVVKLGVNNAFSTNVLQVGPGRIDLNGFNQTVGGLETYFSPGVILNNGAGPSTLTINTGSSNYTGTASIQDGPGPTLINVVKLGSGRQTLATPTNGTASTYTGTTTVSEGELRVNGILGNTVVTVNSGAVLSGDGGTIGGQINVSSGGTFAPGGDSIGALTNNTLILSPGSISRFKLNAFTTNSDLAVVTTGASYDGTLSVTNMGTTPLQVGQVYKLFGATMSAGTFANAASVAIQPGGTGVFIPASGELIISAIPPAPTLNVVQSGNSLQFSWANLNGIYRLQAQTNSLNVGITSTWFNYPGGNTNSLTVPIDPANASVFYRLVAP